MRRIKKVKVIIDGTSYLGRDLKIVVDDKELPFISADLHFDYDNIITGTIELNELKIDEIGLAALKQEIKEREEDEGSLAGCITITKKAVEAIDPLKFEGLLDKHLKKLKRYMLKDYERRITANKR